MTVEEMRVLVTKVYPNETWEARVRGMSDEQVMALYFKFRDNGRLDREPNYYESTRKFRKRGKTDRVGQTRDCGQVLDVAEQISFGL